MNCSSCGANTCASTRSPTCRKRHSRSCDSRMDSACSARSTSAGMDFRSAPDALSILLRKFSQAGSPATGKNTPAMKNIGVTIICITPMNDCICLMRIAIMTPNAVIENASSSCSAKTPRIITGS